MPSDMLEESGANELGEELRAARLRLGWTVADVAAAFRIRPSYLEALEGGNPSELPAADEALGYLRTYAAALGLDPWEMAFRFKAEAPEVMEPELELTSPVPVRKHRSRARAVVVAGLALSVCAGAAAGGYAVSGRNWWPAKTVPLASGRQAPVVPLAPHTLPAAASPASPGPAAQAAQAGMSGMSASVPPGPAPATPGLPRADVVDAISHSPVVSQEWRLVLRAKANSWVQVRVRSGQVLLSRTLRAGEEWPVPPDPDLLLSTGNAGGTELVVDGVAAPPIGNPGAIRRDLPLNPDAIRDGKLPAQMQAASAARPPGARATSPQ